MFGVLRRRVASGSSSASVIGKSWRSSLPGASMPTACSSAGEEISLYPRGVANVQNYQHLILTGRRVSLSPLREVEICLQSDFCMQIQSRPFSSDNGDLVDAVVPFMGESISDGTLATFLKRPGDRVEIDEPIAQVETDKVTIDVASPEAGVIQEFVAKEGDTVEPGTKVAVISKSVAPSEKTTDRASSQPSPPAEQGIVEKPKPKVETAAASEKPKIASPSPIRGSYDKVKKTSCNTFEGFSKHICIADNIQ